MRMRVYEVERDAKGIDSLRLSERPTPVPGANDVLVRMRSASLNYRDLPIVSGQYIRGPLSRNTIAGSDGAGEVVDVGSAVTAFTPGDRVVALFTQGSPPAPLGSPLDGVLAEYAAFEQHGVLQIPEHLSYAEAATLPCAAVTAWNALIRGRQVMPGETVLTLGTGGVSIFALQLAKLAGARVIVTSSSDEKLERAIELGADAGINYLEHPQWEKHVLELTGGRGVEQIVETGALATLPHSYRAVASGGEIALIGVLTPSEGRLDPLPLMLKSATLRGIFVGDRSHFEELLRAIELHRLRPVIDSSFAFADVLAAYRHLQSGKHFGKIAINF